MWFIPRLEIESSNRVTCRMKSSGELFSLFVSSVILINLFGIRRKSIWSILVLSSCFHVNKNANLVQ